jgi:2-oxoglutarate dehydrogenase complex dehydrogenase (E1) component-like enzyme
MSRPEVDGLNTGYAALLLEQYLDNPSAVPNEWRVLFESAPEEVVAMQPGLARLVDLLQRDAENGHEAVAAEPIASIISSQPAQPADSELVAGIAAAMSLVKAFRTHGHLAARIDPLGSEPPGDPALEPERLVPRLTPELMARIPARLLRLSIEGETLADAFPRLQEMYCGPIAYEIEHISDH